MIGPRQEREGKLFYCGFDLDDRVPASHRLRQIDSLIDFSFIRDAVADCYGDTGRPSHDPVVLLKLMFLVHLEKVPSERQLADQLPLRLDWLWFCRFDLDDDLPDHSALSKGRRRWGEALFAVFFQNVLQQCVQAGLVDGSVAHVDGCVIAADADMSQLAQPWYERGLALYRQLEAEQVAALDSMCAAPAGGACAAPVDACAAADDEGDHDPGHVTTDDADQAHERARAAACDDMAPRERVPADAADRAHDEPDQAVALHIADLDNTAATDADAHTADDNPSTSAPRRISPTDPDARLTHKAGRTTLGYKDHRVVDDHCGIITATITTPADVAEADRLLELIDLHQRQTDRRLQTVVADKGYGTGENYRQLRDRGIDACIPHKKTTQAASDKFDRDQFIYDAQQDCYHCPGGQQLTPRGPAGKDQRVRYRVAGGACKKCPLLEACTGSSRGRLLSRHVDQDAIDWSDTCVSPGRRRRLMSRRKSKVEGSFGDASQRHGYKRARSRGLVKMTMQNLLIATIQNVRKLLKYGQRPATSGAAAGVARGVDAGVAAGARAGVPGATVSAHACFAASTAGPGRVMRLTCRDWTRLSRRSRFCTAVFDRLHARLRPLLSPTPASRKPVPAPHGG